jgi:hypothetical protein
MPKTSERIDALTMRVKAAFAAAEARATIATEHAPLPANTPASKIAAAFTLDRLHKQAPSLVAEIRGNLKSAVRAAKADLRDIEGEALQAIQIASYITSKADTLPSNLPSQLHAAALTLRGQPEASIVAKQLTFAAENVSTEINRLGKGWVLQTDAAVNAAASNIGLRVFKAAKMGRHVATYERLTIRAKALSEGVRKKQLNARIGGR